MGHTLSLRGPGFTPHMKPSARSDLVSSHVNNLRHLGNVARVAIYKAESRLIILNPKYDLFLNLPKYRSSS